MGLDDLSSLLEHLPGIVRATRKQAGMTLRQAARDIGIGAATISRFERGHPIRSDILSALIHFVIRHRR